MAHISLLIINRPLYLIFPTQSINQKVFLRPKIAFACRQHFTSSPIKKWCSPSPSPFASICHWHLPPPCCIEILRFIPTHNIEYLRFRGDQPIPYWLCYIELWRNAENYDVLPYFIQSSPRVPCSLPSPLPKSPTIISPIVEALTGPVSLGKLWLYVSELYKKILLSCLSLIHFIKEPIHYICSWWLAKVHLLLLCSCFSYSAIFLLLLGDPELYFYVLLFLLYCYYLVIWNPSFPRPLHI